MRKEVSESSYLVKVKDLKFITTPTGNIVCVVVLHPKTYVTIKSGEDSIEYEVLRLNSLDEIKKLNVNVAQVLDVVFHYTSVQDIQMEFVDFRVKMRPAEIPTKCSICGSKVAVVHGNYACTGTTCPAKSRTMIMNLFVQMFTCMVEEKELSEFDRYLHDFPTYDGDARLYNIIDFLKVFKSLGTVKVQRRADILDARGYSENINDFEETLWDRIESKYYSRYPFEFWDLLPMVRNNRSVLYPFLQNLGPDANDLSNQLTSLPVDEGTKDDFIANIHHIKALFTELTT